MHKSTVIQHYFKTLDSHVQLSYNHSKQHIFLFAFYSLKLLMLFNQLLALKILLNFSIKYLY